MADLPFSLLLPVYHGDDPAHLRRAFESSVVEQTLPPAQVVLVQDGPVGETLDAAVRDIRASSPVPVALEVLPDNRGLASALTAGLARCEHDIVARMDADDVSEPDRFARQLPLLEGGVDLVGSGMHEFVDEAGAEREVGQRTPPLGHDHIVRYARFHSPFNHPTIVFRRSAVEKAGGYTELPYLEDYWLFARMIMTGARVANLAEPLVKYRVSSGSYARRGGLRLFRSELELQRRFRSIGFTSLGQFARNTLVRCGYRLVPEAARRSAYRRVFAKRLS